MANQKEFDELWSRLTVEQRQKELEKREIRPALKEFHDDFEARRRKGLNKSYDLVPSFVEAYRSQRDLSRNGPVNDRGQARATMKIVHTSARQQLGKKDFQRFLKGIK